MAIWAKRAAGGAATVLGAVAIAFYLNERATEQPRFTVEREDGAFAVQRYPALLVAETIDEADRSTALNEGFGRLARFIFAKERRGGDTRRIAMTAPVLADETATGWRTRLVMPRGFTATSLPRPAAGVRIDTVPSRRVAAYRFAGRANDRRLARAEARLRAWIAAQGMVATGPIEFAFYNSPFIPGPLRRNELLLPIAD